MRVITLNVNGIRAAARKGFFSWLNEQNADFVCLQETKAQLSQLDPDIFCPSNYHCYYHDAEKKGYSGVALLSRLKPKEVKYQLGWATADTEGRYIEADYGDFVVASIYLPSGTSGDSRQTLKDEFLERYLPYLQQLKNSGKQCILCGDWNIAHKEIDIKNAKANQNRPGFLPSERAWLDRLFNQEGFIDAFRVVNKAPEQYTWWSNRGQAWSKNVGWRIDYQIVTANVLVKDVAIYKQQRFSDHAPLIIDYQL